MREWIERNFKGDLYIWFIVLAFSIMSVLVVYSATGTLAYQQQGGNTEYYLFKHSLLMGISVFVMWMAHRVDYRYYAKLSQLGLWLSVPLLILVFFVGRSVNSATRVIFVFGQSFQPSDLAKLALIASIAAILAKRQQKIEDVKGTLIPVLIWCGLICGLIALANFSTAALLFVTCMLLMFIGRVPVKYLFRLVLVGILAGAIAMAVGQRGGTVVNRVKRFMDSKDIPYQAEQSFIAVSTGGLVGKGIGHSEQRNMLPNAYNDFIYAIIVEEYGMVGGIVVIILYLFLLYRSMLIVSNSDRPFGGLLAAGLSFSLVLQAFAHMAVSVGLAPVTGQPLPLLSMGGTSLLFTGMAIGIIISVSRTDLKGRSL
ncbi:FtsW/RodA/SpoVE family cell cycle protein [Xanthocytophaga flava]|uniref:FtsW/RodA/SpoVE family cell cycle protein n=1 Tax=Xanthocytophaga flava TaxID=3048013 RepID=UPI0028D57137|nr:FtsW/RodA/SpoVE family cell cycle protein [Xanthocytophaga flavus]MDJ1470585.1 FtsW/RodA/SpoVE family cell cycle protein [Xanthocytophaga flavus]